MIKLFLALFLLVQLVLGLIGRPQPPAEPASTQARVATFNVSLNRATQGGLLTDLRAGDQQARTVAEIVQRTRPDVLLLNELDHDPEALAVFVDEYLGVGQGGADPVDYPYRFTAPVNTGVPSGLDLNHDGVVGGPDDAYGFGLFPGQYGMAVLSRFPIDTAAVRTFQTFRWADMPGNRIPRDYYSPEEAAALRLSSKSHWDVPVRTGSGTVHVLASHPTPPVFDGPEDRNGRRNADEIRFWADYVTPGSSGYVRDDAGVTGGLAAGASFVVVGDQNSDPADGDSLPGAIQQLLTSPRVNDATTPSSEGAVEQAALQGGPNLTHVTPARFDTADFAEPPGNIRSDYVLPSVDLPVTGSGVFWPTVDDPHFGLVGTYDPQYPNGFPSSDHRLVWVDVTVG